jgi:hypothetical protein
MYEATGNPPQIIWERDEQYAIVAFLLLSIEGKMSDDKLKKFDAFMGISQLEANSSNPDWDDDKLLDKLRTIRDTIIREGSVFLDSLEQDESYCDNVMDEIDRIIEETVITRRVPEEALCWPYLRIGKKQRGVLFNYFRMIRSDNGYSKNQKRLLRHLAQKWKVDKSALTVLENSAKSLDEIDEKRDEIQNGDMPHRGAVSTLTKLDAKEIAVWAELGELHIPEEISLFALEIQNYYTNKMRATLGHEEKDIGEEDSLADKIGDVIVEGIFKVGDIICAPFNWMTDKIIEWT